MSQAPKKKKKVVVSSTKKKVAPTVSKTKSKLGKSKSSKTTTTQSMIFGKENYKWIGIGLVFIVLGMFLMAGGSMPSPDVWDESRIYSFRRITLAPIVILIGLGIEVYAIFK